MHSRNLTLAAVAGGAAALAAAVFLLSGGKVAAAPGGAVGRPATASAGRPAEARPRAAYAVPRTGSRGPARAGAAAPGTPAETPASRARDLLARIHASLGDSTALPADLERDLLAFLSGGEENRDALFTLAWDRATPRLVLGNLRVFLAGIADGDLRRTLLAAFDAFDPRAPERAAAAARARDPSLLVADLRAAAGREKVELLKRVPQEAWSEPAVSDWLLESARGDDDEEVRGLSYMLLAFTRRADALPVIAAAVADGGRSAAERRRAAFALEQMPGTLPVEDLLRVYESAPDEVRRNLLPGIARSPAGRRVDDLLLEVLSSAETSEKTFRAAASAIETRIVALGTAASRDLGTRTAEALKGLDAGRTVVALNSLGGAVCHCAPIREAVKDLERTAPAGGALQVALVNTPSLRFALGRN